MRLAAVLFNILSVGAAGDNMYANIERRFNQIARANNASGDRLLVRELHTFISDDGVRRDAAGRAVRRGGPELRRGRSGERALNLKALELMRQALYSAQARVRELQPLLAPYRHDNAFRMPFVLNRLKQLVVDMRRIYTLADRKHWEWRALDQLRWYTHACRKYVDVLHVVERAAALHDQFIRPLAVELKPILDAVEHDRAP